MSLGNEGEKKKILQNKPTLAAKGTGEGPDRIEKKHHQGLLYSDHAASLFLVVSLL